MVYAAHVRSNLSLDVLIITVQNDLIEKEFILGYLLFVCLFPFLFHLHRTEAEWLSGNHSNLCESS